MVKIGAELPKLSPQKNWVSVFLEHPVYAVNSNYVSICSGLAAICTKRFQALSGRISETVRDRANVSINH